MTSSYVTWLRLAFVGSFFLPLVVISCTLLSVDVAKDWQRAAFLLVMILGAWLVFRACKSPFAKLAVPLKEHSIRYSDFLDQVPDRLIRPAIVLSAALSLILELSIIRWHSSEFEVFAFYKNFSLIACFAGLGAGYGLAHKKEVPLIACIPLLLLQFVLLICLRHGFNMPLLSCLLAMPVTEQLSMGLNVKVTPTSYIGISYFLTVVTLLTALALVPVGQLCGRLVSRGPVLESYGLNLLGSLVGVVTCVALSALWTPPPVWFGLTCILTLLFLPYNLSALTASAAGAMAMVLCLCWPVSFPVQRIFSPYQILELGPAENGSMSLRAAGYYYQMLLDLSRQSQEAYPDRRIRARYYDLPYMVKRSPKTVLIVGAGTGNDVAAALRAQAEKVVAVEIDPAIIALGVYFHPEKPYQNPKVIRVVNDARAFLRNSKETFDLIVFALLDSHTTSSIAASLRLDSYVYTSEALKEARAHLNKGGVLSLSFGIGTLEMARKFFLMMEKTFDGHEPVCIGGGYDQSISFFQTRDGNLNVAFENLKELHFPDLTQKLATLNLKVDISNDDWPFLYMPHRVWPLSYLPLVILIIGFTYVLITSLQGQRMTINQPAFFLLGAGFMLVETKAITELCLYFGNTWKVTAITISSVLLMAFLSNIAVMTLKFKRPQLAMAVLIVSLAGGLWVASSGGMPLTIEGSICEVLLITCPVFFSGVAFSCLLKEADSISVALSENILGAIAGGMLEYSAMYLGYRALYLIAMFIYALAFFSSLQSKKLTVN